MNALERALVAARGSYEVDALIAIDATLGDDVSASTIERMLASTVGRSDVVVAWDTRQSRALAPELTMGIGAAAIVTGRGRARFSEVRDQGTELLARVVSASPSARPRLFGGLAFDPGVEAPFDVLGDARFVLPRVTLTLRDGSASWTWIVRPDEIARPDRILREAAKLLSPADESAARPSRAARVVTDGGKGFVSAVRSALAAIDEGALGKVVLARVARVENVAPMAETLAALAQQPGCVRFGFAVAGRRGRGASTDATFMGATPELLVERAGSVARSEALAGTCSRERGDDVVEIAALLASEKDAREHACVVAAVGGGLSSVGGQVHQSARGVRSLRHVHHLATAIEATFDARAPHVLDLAAALHPTPALGGIPTGGARELARALEECHRGWFGAPIGWFDARGDGAFVVGIRSALVRGDQAWAFAGAGIVTGSRPSDELAETAAKMQAMLVALGVEPRASAHGAPPRGSSEVRT